MTTGQAPERDTLSDDDDDVYYCTGERLKLDARKGDEQDNSGVLLLQRRSGKHDGCGTQCPTQGHSLQRHSIDALSHCSWEVEVMIK